MPQPLGMAEFFAMEAGEYLERLDGLVSPAGTPNADEFVRLVRALRGSALMANQQPIAGAAAGLEALARAVREGRRPWDAAIKQVAVRAVDDLKIMVRSVGAWTANEDARARALAQELEQTAGGRVSTKMAGVGADAGTRAFVAREGASLASALDTAALSLTQSPGAADQALSVLKVMQPLRGLAGLADLPPLPDILDGIERAVGEITQRPEASGPGARVLQAAAKALVRAAREAAVGAVVPDSAELTDFATQLGALLEADEDVVPIESLYYADAGPHIVQQGAAPGRPAGASRVDLVSYGEHLKQVADGLERAASAPQRELRLQSLAATLRAVVGAGSGPVAAALGNFAAATREAVARGALGSDAAVFAARLRDAGHLLVTAAQADDQSAANGLERVTATLRGLAAGPTPAATPAPPAAPAVRPTPAPAAAAPRRSGGAAAPGDETADLIGSLLRFRRYADALGLGSASVEELLAGPPALARAPAGGSADADVIPIADLCYSGTAALERALSLRDEVRATLRGAGGDLIEEIFDLVRLGLPPRA
ncbi:MAG: hypothetical protein HY560_06505 [Gemmatimonadetes bacterium]|nr:hypothetical protein [Gemmatimonadota bacterium]